MGVDDWIAQAAALRVAREKEERERFAANAREFGEFCDRARALWEPIEETIRETVTKYNKAAGRPVLQVTESANDLFLRVRQSVATFHLVLDEQSRTLQVSSRTSMVETDAARAYALKRAPDTGYVYAEGLPGDAQQAAQVLLKPWLTSISKG